jgi:hypothetical protein
MGPKRLTVRANLTCSPGCPVTRIIHSNKSAVSSMMICAYTALCEQQKIWQNTGFDFHFLAYREFVEIGQGLPQITQFNPPSPSHQYCPFGVIAVLCPCAANCFDARCRLRSGAQPAVKPAPPVFHRWTLARSPSSRLGTATYHL